ATLPAAGGAGGAVCGAVSKLLTAVALGVVSTRRGVLDNAALHALSRLIYGVFLPALLFSNVLGALRNGVFAYMALLPLAAVLHVVAGALLAVLLARVLALNAPERRLFLVCGAFGNAAAMPLLLCAALFSDVARAKSVAAVSLYLLGWSPLFWSVGYVALAAMSSSQRSSPSSSMSPSRFASKLFTPPLVAALSALLISLIPPLRALLFRTPIPAALQTLGSGYSAAAVLVLAGSLARPQPKFQSGASSLRIGRMAFGLSLCRFLFLPVLAYLVVSRISIGDAFVKFALLLQSVMPCAQNVTVMLTLQGEHEAAAVAARLLLAVYIIGVVPITLALTVFLSASGL
ncbi:unnamed protein product, partial [Agarophyton chilense]